MKTLYEPLSIVDYPLSIGNDTPPFDDSFYDAVVNELYGIGSYTPDYLTTTNGSALIGETNRVLMDGVSKGVSSITEEPDPAFSAALAQNTFIFSGFKTHQELQEVNSLLHDKDGNLRPYDDFKRDVLKLNKEYNQNYLQAEYNHAVQSAQMAAKWQEFLKHKDFVNLQYRTAADERVRAEHAVLHGTTLPVEDKFWTKYLPPLGWNCRCTVVEVLKDSYPESNSDEATRAGDSATSRPAEKIFRFNPGKELKVFPPKHPYLPKGCGNCKRGVGAKNLGYSPNNPSCQACDCIKLCQDTAPAKEWIKGNINRVRKTERSCKIAIDIGAISEKFLKDLNDMPDFGGNIKSTSIRLSDERILHALRRNKQEVGKAITDEEMENLPLILTKCDIYADDGCLLYIYENEGRILKLVFNPHLKIKVNRVNEDGFIHFSTATVISKADFKSGGYKLIKKGDK